MPNRTKLHDMIHAPASVTSAAVVISVPSSGYQGGSFHVTSIGSGNTIQVEQSNDNVNWVPLLVSPTSYVGPTQTYMNVNGLFQFSSCAAYVRARVSAYGSGTVTVSLTLKAVASPANTYSILGSSNQYIGNTNIAQGFIDSTTALGSAATFTGTTRATASFGAYSSFVAFAYADVAGTLYIDWTLDNGATWQVLSSVAVSAGTSQQLKALIPGFTTNVNLRARYVNGASAQATFRLASSFITA